MWFASRAAQDLWDPAGLRALADRQVELARAEGVVTVLPIALSLLMLVQMTDGDLDGAEASCDEIDAIKEVTGNPLPPYGRLLLAAYRGQADQAERLAERVRADGLARGEGHALSAANFSEAVLYNGLGRFAEAVASGRRELPYTRELNLAMRTLLELVEAAAHTGERALAEQALEQLAGVTRPVGTSYALAVLAMAEAQLRAGTTPSGSSSTRSSASSTSGSRSGWGVAACCTARHSTARDGPPKRANSSAPRTGCCRPAD